MLNNWTRVFALMALMALVAIGVLFGASLSDPAWAQRAANVNDVDNPDKLPVVLNFAGYAIAAGSNTGEACMETVPAGKRWVIEHVSGTANVPTGQFPHVHLADSIPFANIHALILYNQGPGYTGNDIYVASQPIKLRLGPGQRLCFKFSRNSTTDAMLWGMYASGYEIVIP
jgi:hypothetical protein